DQPAPGPQPLPNQPAVTASAESRVHERAVVPGFDRERIDCRAEENGKVRIGAHSEKFSVPGGGSVPTCMRPRVRRSSHAAMSQISKWLPCPTSITSFFNPANLRNAGETRMRP